MKLSERCDEIVRLIEESLADMYAAIEAASDRPAATDSARDGHPAADRNAVPES